MGNLTRDPEMRQTQSGRCVTKAGIAVNERMPDGQGGYRDQAHFFEVTFFGKRAESFAKFFSKGKPVLIDGRLEYSSWDDKETGKKRSSVGIVGLSWNFVGGRDDAGNGGGGGGYSSQANTQQPAPNFPSGDDFGSGSDVPF